MLNFLTKLIRQAGDICKTEQGRITTGDIEFKNSKDIVTAIDKKVEDFLVRAILEKYPDHNIFGEETGKTSKPSRYCWIIDPIDGTTSYLHQQPFYAVSIAVEHQGDILAGAVYQPAMDELFSAQKDHGAFLNRMPIRVSQTSELINAVLATGFACLRGGLSDNNLSYFNTIVPRIRDIRRYGSAAIDLCYVACGRIDGFWEMNLNPYDIAAGALIVQEAGGMVTDFSGGTDYPDQGIIASNASIMPLLSSFFTKDTP